MNPCSLGGGGKCSLGISGGGGGDGVATRCGGRREVFDRAVDAAA